MAGKNSGSDNPWAEMSRLNLDSKEAKAPAPDSPRAAAIKQNQSPEVAKEKSAPATSVAEAKLIKEASAEEEVVKYSADDLEEMSLKELQALAKESGVDFKDLSKAEIIEALLAEIGTDQESEEELVLLEDEEESDEEDLEAEEIDGEMSIEEAMALLGEDSETEDDFSEAEFEQVEVEVQEGDASFELDDNNSNN